MTSRLALIAALLVTVGARAESARPAPRPNFLIFLADDLGYMDIGANNPRTFYETPNIDSLAKRGLRFTSGYAACCVCSPTRASIMTGKYPPRTGITAWIGCRQSPATRVLTPPNRDHLALEETTIAERLREAGYATFFAGKWHLGQGDYGPSAQGFPANLRGQWQFYYPPTDKVYSRIDDPKTTDQIGDAAVEFISAHKGGPFFAYLPFQAVHVPVAARPDLVRKYERKRASAPPDRWGRERDSEVRLVQNHAAYAAMVEQMDRAIGRVLAALQKKGLAEQTVVVFTSDNGGLATRGAPPTANVPLRAGKGWPYEGGMRTAWIVVAPGVTRPGTVCDTPVITNDLYPTLLDLAGLPLMPGQHRDGVSLAALLRGRTLDRRAPLFWHYPHYSPQGGAPAGSIRDGDWKLIEWYEDGSLELFNLREDLGEKNNLASKERERARAMHEKLEAWRVEVQAAMPAPNPDYRPPQPKAAAKKPRAGGRPNVVFILTDDLGINDLGCYGRREHHTPNLDRLAAAGIRFTSAYCAQPICSASRAAIQTGRHPARLHLTTYLPGRPDCPSQKLLHPIIPQQLALEEKTLAEYLKEAGYATACIGKWHLGGKGFGPLEQGFDVYHAGRAVTTPSETEGGKGEYDLTAQAIKFVEANRQRPFFLYLAHNTPHIPYAAKAHLVDKNRGAFEPVYAAVIETLDDTVGLLLARLEALGLSKNTVVIFTSDNGGLHVPEGPHERITHNTPYRAGKGFLDEGGLRIPLVVRWPGRVPEGRVIDAPVVNTDWVPTLLELAGAGVPGGLDGASLAPLLLGRGDPPQRALFWHYPHYTNQGSRPAGAVREGDWKLIENYDDAQVELYNLAQDPSETRNLAGREAERVKRLRAELAAWRSATGVQTNGSNPRFDSALHRALYVDVDVSRYNPSTADAELQSRVLQWRKQMNAVLPPQPKPRKPR